MWKSLSPQDLGPFLPRYVNTDWIKGAAGYVKYLKQQKRCAKQSSALKIHSRPGFGHKCHLCWSSLSLEDRWLGVIALRGRKAILSPTTMSRVSLSVVECIMREIRWFVVAGRIHITVFGRLG